MSPRWQAFFLAGFILLADAAGQPQTSGDALPELADKVVGLLGPVREAEVSLRNLTSAPAAGIRPARAAFERELKRAGLILTGSAATRVLVTISESLDSRIWTAEILRSDRRDVVMVSRKRPPAADQAGSSLPAEIRRRLVLEQSDPILDVAMAGDDLLVLSPTSLSVSRRSSQGWETKQEVPLPESYAQSRDLRGRLVPRQGGFTAYLPGLTCDAGMDPTLHASCGAGEPDWPLGLGNVKLAPGRNFFTRGTLPPFFSLAAVQAEDARWICAGVDGRVRVLDGDLQQIGSLDGFGSDVAALSNPCGPGAALIASLPPSAPGRCALRAFEVSSGQAVPLSPALELPGTLTALWPSESSAAVVAVTRNTRNGNHAAYQLFLSCGR